MVPEQADQTQADAAGGGGQGSAGGCSEQQEQPSRHKVEAGDSGTRDRRERQAAVQQQQGPPQSPSGRQGRGQLQLWFRDLSVQTHPRVPHATRGVTVIHRQGQGSLRT